jgi:hypothetical protein
MSKLEKDPGGRGRMKKNVSFAGTVLPTFLSACPDSVRHSHEEINDCPLAEPRIAKRTV